MTQSVVGEERLTVVWVEKMESADELQVENPVHHALAVDLHLSVHHGAAALVRAPSLEKGLAEEVVTVSFEALG